MDGVDTEYIHQGGPHGKGRTLLGESGVSPNPLPSMSLLSVPFTEAARAVRVVDCDTCADLSYPEREMAEALELPSIDLSSPDRISAAESIRQACLDHGFFYLVNHGIEDEMLKQVFDESRKFFSMTVQEKMRLACNKEHRGYTSLYSESHDPSIHSKGDLKESFYIGPMEGGNLNQWPFDGVLPHWRTTLESYYEKILTVGKRLTSLIALALNLDENFFEKVGAVDAPMGFVRLLHYPGVLAVSDTETLGASAHSDFGLITLLATDGVRGLQICREKDKVPRVWEDVPHVNGSTMHRVIATAQERYSVAFFLDPNSDCVVECIESCCSEASPPKFPPIRCGDYLEECFRLIYSIKGWQK